MSIDSIDQIGGDKCPENHVLISFLKPKLDKSDIWLIDDASESDDAADKNINKAIAVEKKFILDVDIKFDFVGSGRHGRGLGYKNT